MADQNLIQKLLNPQAHKNPVKNLNLIETHISWVILTGDFVYKIKKPVDFEFLNYTTLEKRKFYCEEEIRLNQMLAPELYLGVVPITGTNENPMIEGEGPILDYALKMREFSQDALFSKLLNENKLTPELIDETAKMIAQFHEKIPAASADSVFGTPEHVHAPVIQNFDQIRPMLNDAQDLQQLQQLQEWSDEQFKRYKAIFAQRKANGFIRECHGDIHLGNIILLNNQPKLFDAIEFNDDFRWTDTIADIAFLAMDLCDHQQHAYAQRLLNTYFNTTGDYEGLLILPYYAAYRAIVRAKVSLFRIFSGVTAEEEMAIRKKYRNLMALAQNYTQQTQPTLFLLHGMSGSGKSTLARYLSEKINAFTISSDIERKRLFGLDSAAKTNSGIEQGIYHPDATQQTYQHLTKNAEFILKAGYHAIVDAAFLKLAQRQLFEKLAKELKTPFIILHCHTSRKNLELAITERNLKANEASEADFAVLDLQEKIAEPLTETEKSHAITIDTAHISEKELLSAVKKIIPEFLTAKTD